MSITCTATTGKGTQCKRNAIAETPEGAQLCSAHLRIHNSMFLVPEAAPEAIAETPEAAPIISRDEAALVAETQAEYAEYEGMGDGAGLWNMDGAQAALRAQDAILFDRTDEELTPMDILATKPQDAAQAAPIVNEDGAQAAPQGYTLYDASAQVAPDHVLVNGTRYSYNESDHTWSGHTIDALLTMGHVYVPQVAQAAQAVSYTQSTTPMLVAIPRIDPVVSHYKPNTRDADIAYFDKVLAKKADIRKLVMAEYFKLPSYWVPSVKLKAGESQADRLIRDWESWRKAYARSFKDGKLKKIDGVWFFAAKITCGAFVALVRAGKRAYCLQYAKDFKTDEVSFAGMIGIAECYPLVMDVITVGNEYHRVKGKAASTAEQIQDAQDAYTASFDRACAALRLIDTMPQDAAQAAQDGAGAMAHAQAAFSAIKATAQAEDAAQAAPIV